MTLVYTQADIAHAVTAIWCALQGPDADPTRLLGAHQALGCIAITFQIEPHTCLYATRDALNPALPKERRLLP